MLDWIWTKAIREGGDSSIILGCLVLLLALISFYISGDQADARRRFWLFYSKSPPYVPHLPFIGSSPFLPKDVPVFVAYQQMVKRYGNVFVVTHDNSSLVVVNGSDEVRGFLSRGKTVGSRPLLKRIKVYNPQFLGLADTPYSPHWREQRKFCFAKLRNMTSSEHFQDHVRNEFNEILSEFLKMKQRSFCPMFILQNCVAKISCNVVLGTNYKMEDANFIKLVSLIQESLELLTNGLIGGQTPWKRFFTSQKSADDKMEKVRNELMDFIKQHIPSDIDDNNESQNEFGMLYEFTKEMEKGDIKSFTPDQRLYLMVDLFNAGAETTMLTLLWGLLYMANNPQYQMKMQQELDECQSCDEFVTYENCSRLPYCEAVFLEVQRMASVVPLSLPRFTTADVQLGDYVIPSDTTVITNLWSVHRDPKYWKEPNVFNPDNFLSPENKVINRKQIIPFSEGSRRCVGEHLAKVAMFALFTNMVKEFTFLPPDGVSKLDEDGIFRITHSPKDFDIRAIPRNPH